jgi:hypothetical protein
VDKKHSVRTIIIYKEYFNDFFIKQRQKVKDKIIWTFDLIEELHRLKRILNTLKAPMGSMK